MKYKNKTFEKAGKSDLLQNMVDSIETTDAELQDKGRREYLPINKLIENPLNEEVYTLDNIEEFAETMSEEGFEGSHLIGVYDMHDGTYLIYSGHRRWKSAMEAGIEFVPCFIKEQPETEAERALDLLSANQNGRVKDVLTIAREIKLYKEKVIAGQKDQRKKIADYFRISEAQVYRYESISRLIKELQEYTKYAGIPFTALSTASSLSEEEQYKLKEMLDKYFEEKASKISTAGEEESKDTEDMEAKAEDIYEISKPRLLAMIKAIQNKEEDKPKAKTASSKCSDEKVLKAVQSLEKIAKKKSITLDNPQEVIAELKRLDKIIEQLRLKAEDCLK